MGTVTAATSVATTTQLPLQGRTEERPLEKKVETAANRAKKGLSVAGKVFNYIGKGAGFLGKVLKVVAPKSGPAMPVLAGIATVASVASTGLNFIAGLV